MNNTALNRYDWEFLFCVPRCHKWFIDKISGRVAVCDGSGKFPDETHDGVIWLTNPCIIKRELYPGDTGKESFIYVEIPGEKESGERTIIGGTNNTEACHLVEVGLAKFKDVYV